MAGAIHLHGAGMAYLPVLRRLVTRGPGVVPRPWHRRELHNPWSRAAAGIDAWAVLELCTALGRLPAVTALIGGDVILFDTALLPDCWDEAGQGPVLFPVDPPAGLTVLCALAPARVDCAGADAVIDLAPGDLAVIAAATGWQASGGELFAARYFPAASRYIRDPVEPAQLALMERLPLFNFATMPLWLVAGEDRAGNDFVTGFNPRPPYWSAPPEDFAL